MQGEALNDHYDGWSIWSRSTRYNGPARAIADGQVRRDLQKN